MSQKEKNIQINSKMISDTKHSKNGVIRQNFRKWCALTAKFSSCFIGERKEEKPGVKKTKLREHVPRGDHVTQTQRSIEKNGKYWIRLRIWMKEMRWYRILRNSPKVCEFLQKSDLRTGRDKQPVKQRLSQYLDRWGERFIRYVFCACVTNKHIKGTWMLNKTIVLECPPKFLNGALRRALTNEVLVLIGNGSRYPCF
jgi:hypothetical protein